ncbi:hypothetical protein Tco_0792595 [Tanacetum coccineum]
MASLGISLNDVITVAHSAEIKIVLRIVTIPPSTGNLSILWAVDGTAWISRILGLPMIPLYDLFHLFFSLLSLHNQGPSYILLGILDLKACSGNLPFPLLLNIFTNFSISSEMPCGLVIQFHIFSSFLLFMEFCAQTRLLGMLSCKIISSAFSTVGTGTGGVKRVDLLSGRRKRQ